MKKTFLKYILFLFSMLLISICVNAQLLKEFFIPSESNYNNANFYFTTKTGERTDSARVRNYVRKRDGSYDILDTIKFSGKPVLICVRTVRINEKSVVMFKEAFSKHFDGTITKPSYENKILLKMPSEEENVVWHIDKGPWGTTYTSSWTTVMVDGIRKKAIKVISEMHEMGAPIAEYYVQGIGLMKIESIGRDGKIIPLENFDGLSYEK